MIHESKGIAALIFSIATASLLWESELANGAELRPETAKSMGHLRRNGGDPHRQGTGLTKRIPGASPAPDCPTLRGR